VHVIPDTESSSAPPAKGIGRFYPWYVTGVLMLAYVLSFLDRQILYLMVEPIKADLHLSDFQFSLLTGGAFGIFYTLMGLPIGWLADRYNRKNLIAIGITAWSVMTALCGLARTFPMLFLARIGVGVGEATLSPSAYSLLSDSFDRKRLPKAMSVYTFGIFIGVGLAMIIGGELIHTIQKTPDMILPVLGHMRSWHIVFLTVGIPGLIVACWVSTLKEPPRSGASKVAAKSGGFPFSEVFAFIGRYPLMAIALFVGPACFSILADADSWYPTLFIRLWHWDVAVAGRINGLSSLIAGPLGLIFAGWYSSRAFSKGRSDACLSLTAWAALGIMLPAVLLPMAPNATLMAVCLFPFKFFIGFVPVLVPSAIQMVSPNHLRAQMGAVFLFTTGLIGTSMGPILPAFLSDYVFTGTHALPHALSVTAVIVGPVTFGLIWFGLKQYRQRYASLVAAEDAATLT
jgi:MFS family permease